MDTATAKLRKPFGPSVMTQLSDGKDIYLVIERQDDGEIVLPTQILNKGGRAKVLADLMSGYYGTPVMIIRLYANGIWTDVSSSFATFWYYKLVDQNRHFITPLPPFLDTYLHAEFRSDWCVNEAA